MSGHHHHTSHVAIHVPNSLRQAPQPSEFYDVLFMVEHCRFCFPTSKRCEIYYGSWHPNHSSFDPRSMYAVHWVTLSRP